MDLTLSSLKPNKGARKTSRRIGRGNGSGSGKTSGKGHKGQKARSGASIPAYFEGGQMPLYRRIPKIGFRSRKRILGLNRYDIVDLSVLDKFDDGATVTIEALKHKGFGKGTSCRAGIKILGSGKLTKKVNVQAHAFSKSAKAKIEELGGSVEIVSKLPETPEKES